MDRYVMLDEFDDAGKFLIALGAAVMCLLEVPVELIPGAEV
jgi:hypothetical protein